MDSLGGYYPSVPGCCERGHDLVPDVDRADARAGLDDVTDEFMAHDVAGVAGFDAAVEV